MATFAVKVQSQNGNGVLTQAHKVEADGLVAAVDKWLAKDASDGDKLTIRRVPAK